MMYILLRHPDISTTCWIGGSDVWRGYAHEMQQVVQCDTMPDPTSRAAGAPTMNFIFYSEPHK